MAGKPGGSARASREGPSAADATAPGRAGLASNPARRAAPAGTHGDERALAPAETDFTIPEEQSSSE